MFGLSGSNDELRFYEGANYVGFEAPALAGDQIWVLPDADGAANSMMMTDGSGNLTWNPIRSFFNGTFQESFDATVSF